MQRRLFLGLAFSAFFSALSVKNVFGASILPNFKTAPVNNNPKFIELAETKPNKPMTFNKILPLPAPDKSSGAPLMQALEQRRATRNLRGMESGGKTIPEAMLSNLLWATWGINRNDGKRTAPTANNSQAVNVYVALKTGIWLYNAQKNQLEIELEQDVRGSLGKAPIALIYAAKDDSWGAMSVGSLYQNAGLYCASVGLGNVVRSSNTETVDKLINIPSGYKIWVTQAVGWPL